MHVIVAKVVPSSSAAEAGLLVGDILLRIGTASISDPAEAIAAVRTYRSGDRTVVVVDRNGKQVERTVLFKHALKNASLPIVTNAALAFGGLLGGAIITETIFNWDGLGFWIFASISSKDIPVMQAMFYLIALCVIAANFMSDILYGVLDPRIRYE